MSSSIGQYRYDILPTETSFRVVELLPGKNDDPIACRLYTVDWTDPPDYEAVSYMWGDPSFKVPIDCGAGNVEVTTNLWQALNQLRREDRSRLLWTDALCTNQSNIPERGKQVNQMKKIYEHARTVLIWLGEDNDKNWVSTALRSISLFSDAICEIVGIEPSDLGSVNDVYQKVVVKNRRTLPLPEKHSFVNDGIWDPLIWFYSHQYFTRVWVIQEINANERRLLHCGSSFIEWDRVHLVACYFIMETAWSKQFKFSKTYCWWVALLSGRFKNHTRDWLHILYLASNFSCADLRDHIYSLRGLMDLTKGGQILHPDYEKSLVDVYRDSVEAAFEDFETADVLLYTTGKEDPSWIPQWNKAMLFRNPFRFGKTLPWKPSGTTRPIWRIDKAQNLLELTGSIVDTIQSTEAYNESYFGNALLDSSTGRNILNQAWRKILQTMSASTSCMPLNESILTAAAVSFCFGLDEHADPGREKHVLGNFLAYLKLFLDQEILDRHIPQSLSVLTADADGHAFGKPVWDFEYPESTFFVTGQNLIGCSTAVNQPGDVVYIPLGCTYPLILRPEKDHFLLKGFAFVHGVMYGENQDLPKKVFKIY